MVLKPIRFYFDLQMDLYFPNLFDDQNIRGLCVCIVAIYIYEQILS